MQSYIFYFIYGELYPFFIFYYEFPLCVFPFLYDFTEKFKAKGVASLHPRRGNTHPYAMC